MESNSRTNTDKDSKSSKSKRSRTWRKEKLHYVHVNFYEKERLNKFNDIKTRGSFVSDVDVMRHCIDQAYELIAGEKGSINLESVIAELADYYLANDYIRQKYFISDVNSLVNTAMKEWIRKNRTSITIHNHSFVNSLPKEEHDLALVFIEHQLDHPKGFSFEDIKGYLEGIKEDEMRIIIDKFIRNQLVTSIIRDGVEYYHAPLP
ncbi:MAG: hypothetical protein ACXAEU_18310 [Candidatus Hodarchaeales archaeon]|jgi:hypothetical protein